MRKTIITCDGCGREDFKTSIGFGALKSRAGVLCTDNTSHTLDSFRADLCPTCLRTFNTRWSALDPSNWPRGEQQEQAND